MKLRVAQHWSLAYRNWHGLAVGQVVTQVWEGYASRLFISFGELTPSTYILPSGRPRRPHGEIELQHAERDRLGSDSKQIPLGKIGSHPTEDDAKHCSVL